MKLLLLLLLLFNSLFSQSNDKSFGQVEYVKTINYNQKNLKSLKESQKIFLKYADSAIFVLNFSKTKALFQIKKKLSLDDDYERKIIAATVFGGGKGKYFTNLSENISLHQIETIGELFLIKSFSSDLNWKIINESKKIGPFVCYKSILNERFKTTNNEFKNITIEAWFCPEIPFSYGPIGYSGLPGLILELKNDKATYKLSNIEFFDKINFNLKKPKKGKIVSKNTFDYLVEKFVKNRSKK